MKPLAVLCLLLTLVACTSGAPKPRGSTPQSSAAPSASATSTPSTTASSPVPISVAPVALAVLPGNGAAPFDQARTLSAPAGSSVQVWARLDDARFAVWTPSGDLLVSQPAKGQVTRLHPNGSGAPTATVLLSGLTSPQGLAFDILNGQTVLYVAGSTAIWRYVWSGTTVGARTTLVQNLPGSGGFAHPLKEVAIGSDHTVYFDIGSSSNADPADRTAGEAQIDSIRPDGSGRQVVMTGVRNGDGLAFDPTGQLWTAVNQRDLVTYPLHGAAGGQADAYGKVVQDYVNDHPADQVVKVVAGRELGWPYCNPDQTLSSDANDPYHQMPFRNDVVANADGRFDCSTLTPVERGVPAHSAPLGLTFLAGSSVPARFQAGAALATHGSNNHVPPRAAALYWLSFDAASGLGPVQPLLTGFADSDGNRWGKPVDAVPGPDGALYITDDTAGAVYRLVLAS